MLKIRTMYHVPCTCDFMRNDIFETPKIEKVIAHTMIRHIHLSFRLFDELHEHRLLSFASTEIYCHFDDVCFS